MASLLVMLSAIMVLVAVSTEVGGQNNFALSETPVTEVCLGCICQASTGCKLGRQCEGDSCGLFGITWAYWADAGKPTLRGEPVESNTAYSNCANDPHCAAASVQNYMKRFAQDCNGDGRVDCYDYMAIHKKGGYGCSGELPFNYVNVFNQCINVVAAHQG